jgi:pSer/pThr/pTyr-binding forkhead associated (FHA) protein
MDAKLIMFRESGDRLEFDLSRTRTVIGRKKDCQIRIPLSEISRNHLAIEVRGGRLHVKDLDSANGTFVNNQRVRERELSAGDHLIIGPVVFTVQINGQPERLQPVKTKLKRKLPVEPSLSGELGDSRHIYSPDDEDPISELEALAASASQTALEAVLDEEELNQPARADEARRND